MANNAVIYLVGDKDAPKTNQWLAMTNSETEAKRLLEELPGAVTMKEKEVRPRGKRNRG
jgi:hypothetical protein